MFAIRDSFATPSALQRFVILITPSPWFLLELTRSTAFKPSPLGLERRRRSRSTPAYRRALNLAWYRTGRLGNLQLLSRGVEGLTV
jgi:hypothetical protein